MMESRRVSSRGCVKFVPCVRDLAEEFQGRGVGAGLTPLRPWQLPQRLFLCQGRQFLTRCSGVAKSHVA